MNGCKCRGNQWASQRHVLLTRCWATASLTFPRMLAYAGGFSLNASNKIKAYAQQWDPTSLQRIINVGDTAGYSKYGDLGQHGNGVLASWRLEVFLQGSTQMGVRTMQDPNFWVRHTLAKVKSTAAQLASWQASLIAFARTPGPQKYVCRRFS